MNPLFGNLGMTTQFQPPAQASMQLPNYSAAAPKDFGSRFKAALPDILMGIGTSLATNNWGNAGKFAAESRQRREQEGEQAKAQNATVQWLASRGREDLAGLVAQGALPAMQAIQEASKSTQADNPKFGLELQYGQDKDGNIVPFQASNQGGLRKVDLPEGITPLGPEGVAAARARGGIIGKTEGEARGQIAFKSAAAKKNVDLVDSIINHPSLDRAVGPVQGRLMSFSAGARDFDERVEQLKGVAFLEARQELKGGGQITDYEGQRAEVALVRASQAKSEEDFKAAMMEFRDAIVRGYQLLEQQAGVSSQPTTPGRLRYNPQTGDVE